MSCNDMIQVTCFCYLFLQIRPTTLQYLRHHKKTDQLLTQDATIVVSPVHNKQSSRDSGVSSGSSVIVYIKSYGLVLEYRIFRWFLHMLHFLNLIRVLANTVTMDKFIFPLFITYLTEI